MPILGLDFKDVHSFLISLSILFFLSAAVLFQSNILFGIVFAIGGIVFFHYGLVNLIKKDADEQRNRELENENKELTNKLNALELDLKQKTVDFEIEWVQAEVDCVSDLEVINDYGREDYCHKDRPFVVYTIQIVMFNKSSQLDKSIRTIDIAILNSDFTKNLPNPKYTRSTIPARKEVTMEISAYARDYSGNKNDSIRVSITTFDDEVIEKIMSITEYNKVKYFEYQEYMYNPEYKEKGAVRGLEK